MHFTTLLTASLALAGYATAQCKPGATADCKPGYKYCSSTLNNRANADSAIIAAFEAAGKSVPLQGFWGMYLFHCNDDYTLTLSQTCSKGRCNDGGLNKDDFCYNGNGHVLPF